MSEEKNFNDAELQDIMEEIESLEKEFEDGGDTAECREDGPLELTAEDLEELSDLDEVENNVVEIEPQQVKSQGSGQMDLNLNFRLGDHQAHLSVSQSSGLKVCLKGVELTLDENGCQVIMDGGVSFNVPFDSNRKAS